MSSDKYCRICGKEFGGKMIVEVSENRYRIYFD